MFVNIIRMKDLISKHNSFGVEISDFFSWFIRLLTISQINSDKIEVTLLVGISGSFISLLLTFSIYVVNVFIFIFMRIIYFKESFKLKHDGLKSIKLICTLIHR